jgi:hypothetical protein
MLPPFNERGDLPPGVHAAAWDELAERFGAGAVRQTRLRTLRHLHLLATATGCLERFLVFGSFVTNKHEPGDVDVVLIMAEDFLLEQAPREREPCSRTPTQMRGSARVSSGSAVAFCRTKKCRRSWSSGKPDVTERGGASWR